MKPIRHSSIYKLTAYTALFTALMLGYAISYAGETIELQVKATVIGNCKVLSVQDINFGSLDPGQAVDTTSEGVISFACTRGIDYTLSADKGENYETTTASRRMVGSGGFYLPYQVENEQVSGLGQGFSNPLNFSLIAAVKGVHYKDLPAESFTDTIRLTLEP